MICRVQMTKSKIKSKRLIISYRAFIHNFKASCDHCHDIGSFIFLCFLLIFQCVSIMNVTYFHSDILAASPFHLYCQCSLKLFSQGWASEHVVNSYFFTSLSEVHVNIIHFQLLQSCNIHYSTLCVCVSLPFLLHCGFLKDTVFISFYFINKISNIDKLREVTSRHTVSQRSLHGLFGFMYLNRSYGSQWPEQSC